MRSRRGVFGPQARRDDDATQAVRVVEEDRRSMRPKDPASLRVGPETAHLRRSRSSTYLPSDTLRRSDLHLGRLWANAASLVFRQSLESGAMANPEHLPPDVMAARFGVGKLNRHLFICLGPDCTEPSQGEKTWEY